MNYTYVAVSSLEIFEEVNMCVWWWLLKSLHERMMRKAVQVMSKLPELLCGYIIFKTCLPFFNFLPWSGWAQCMSGTSEGRRAGDPHGTETKRTRPCLSNLLSARHARENTLSKLGSGRVWSYLSVFRWQKRREAKEKRVTERTFFQWRTQLHSLVSFLLLIS